MAGVAGADYRANAVWIDEWKQTDLAAHAPAAESGPPVYPGIATRR
jgi:hypothetical protein